MNPVVRHCSGHSLCDRLPCDLGWEDGELVEMLRHHITLTTAVGRKLLHFALKMVSIRALHCHFLQFRFIRNYIGQEFRYSPENAFYIFNQQIHFIIFFET